MSFFRFFALFALIFISGCYNKDFLEQRMLHEYRAQDRINDAQKNSEHLFEELQ